MADEPQFLNIPDSLGRDLDNGKCDNMDIADFMPDSSLERIAEQTADYRAQSKAPVHMEDLSPISKAQAAQMTRFDGDSLPKAPATRRVIPRPYQRDRVMGGKHGKTWREIDAHRIAKGDIITDLGLVQAVRHELRYEGEGKLGPIAVGTNVVVFGPGGNVKTYDVGDLVKVFRKH